MSSYACDYFVFLDEFNCLSEELDTTIFDYTVSNTALYVSSNSAVVDSHFYVGLKVLEVGFLGLDLCDPLQLAASFIPVFIDKPDDSIIKSQYGGIDSAFFTYLPRFKNFLICKIVSQ